MKVDVALELMRSVAEEACASLREGGVSASVEVDYMNSFFKSLDSAKGAKFITVSVVIRADGTPEGEEYCLSLGADVRGGNINGDVLARDIDGFKELVRETRSTIDSYEDKTEAVIALAKRAEEDFDKLMAKIDEEQKRNRTISYIGMGLILLGCAILFIIAFLS